MVYILILVAAMSEVPAAEPSAAAAVVTAEPILVSQQDSISVSESAIRECVSEGDLAKAKDW